MKCQSVDCDGDLYVMHTCQAGGRAESRDLKCDLCKKRYSSVTFLIERPTQQRKKKGFGAVAIAKKVINGFLVLQKSDP